MSSKRNKYSAKLRALAKEELIRRKSIPKLLDVCFDKQVAFIKDPSKRKALFVARRSGKSFTLAAYMILCALQNPRVKVLYIGLTKTSAENAMWTHTIEEICREFNIEHIYNRNTKTVSFKNGSTIRLTGADASPAEMARLLGGKYFLVAVDECQSYSQDLRELINTNLGPAVADYATINNGGVICMAGTPGNKLGDHYWYQVTKEGEREPGWSVHHWDCLDNPHMKENILAQWEDFRVRHGDNYKDTTWFKQQWMCQWVIDDIAKVYKFTEANLLLESLTPEQRRQNDLVLEARVKSDIATIQSLRDVDSKWKYVLGVDLGWTDPNGFVVGAYSNNDRVFYIVESHKIQGITVDEIAGIVSSLHDKYKFRSMVVDTGGGGKLVAETMRQRYQLPFKAADKAGEKAARIAAMNSDFVTKHIKIVPGSNEGLIKEWNELVVDHIKQQQGIFKEADKYHNHLADAALYCFNEARHFNAKEDEPTKEPDFADWLIEHRKRSTPPKQSFWQKQKEQLQIRQLVKKYRDNK